MSNLNVKVVSGEGLKNMDVIKPMDPYCLVQYGSQKSTSKVLPNAGTAPVWNSLFTFRIEEHEGSVVVTIFDKDPVSDDLVGTATISLEQVFQTGYDDVTVPVLLNNKQQHGTLRVLLSIS